MRRRPRPRRLAIEAQKYAAEANTQKAEAERQRQIAESQAAEAERQKGEAEKSRENADAQAAEAKRLAIEAQKYAAEANTQKAEAERQRQIAESQAAEAVRQKAEADAQAREAKINETLSLAALSRIALADNLPADAVKLALAAWPRIGDEKRSMLRRTIDSFVRAFPDFRERLRLVGHQNWVVTANFSPDGKRIVTASWDKTARVWDAATGAEIMVLAGA